MAVKRTSFLKKQKEQKRKERALEKRDRKTIRQERTDFLSVEEPAAGD
jgi:hypothetical protein